MIASRTHTDRIQEGNHSFEPDLDLNRNSVASNISDVIVRENLRIYKVKARVRTVNVNKNGGRFRCQNKG